MTPVPLVVRRENKIKLQAAFNGPTVPQCLLGHAAAVASFWVSKQLTLHLISLVDITEGFPCHFLRTEYLYPEVLRSTMWRCGDS